MSYDERDMTDAEALALAEWKCGDPECRHPNCQRARVIAGLKLKLDRAKAKIRGEEQ